MLVEYAIRHQAASELPSTTEGLYQALFEQAPDAIVIATLRGSYIAANQHACVLLGYTRAELLELTWWDVLLADYPIAGLPAFEDLHAGETLHGERRVRCKTGHVRDVAISAHRMANAYLVMFLHDITAQKQIERELDLKSSALDLLFAAFGIADVYAKQSAPITPSQEQMADMLGQLSASHSIDPTRLEQSMGATRQHPHDDMELAVGRKAGSTFATSLALEKAVGCHAATIYSSNASDTPTRAAQAVDQRLAQEARLTAIAAVAPGVLFSLRRRPDGSRCMPYASPAIHTLCGLQPAELVDDATPLFARIHADDIVLLAAAVAEAEQSMQPVRIEYRIRHPDKGEIWVESHAAPEREADGGMLWHGFLQDITQRKQTEEQMRYQAAVLQNASDAIIATDLNFVITSWNQAAEALYGWCAADVIGQPIGTLLRTEFVDVQPEQVFQHFFVRGSWEGEVTQRCQDDTTLTILSSIAAIKDSAGTPVGMVSVNRDITAHKQAAAAQLYLEEQRHYTQKLESIGRLVGGIAHNYNNLLMVILGYCDIMSDHLDSDDPLRTELEQIWQAGTRAAAITRQLLAFGRKQIFSPAVIDLNDLIANLRPTLQQLIGADIILAMDFHPGLWPITADPDQIEQAIMNLVINARDAMPHGGLLSIATRNVAPDDDAAPMLRGAPRLPRVMLVLTDSGSGMDEHIRSQIFEPFFTTKAPGQGTGLGLASVYGIITQSGGTIRVDSQSGFGSSFTIYLPAHSDAAPDRVALKPVAQPEHAPSPLLEDEDPLRYLVRAMFQAQSSTVGKADN